MGVEASCTATFGAARGAGKALLESSELIFRGPFRLKIPFASIRRVKAARGILTVTFAEGLATFDLGKAAEAWALKIRYPRPLIDKIGILPGMRVQLVGARAGVGDADFWSDLRARVRARPREQLIALILYFVKAASALDRLGELRETIAQNGSIWVIYPKGARVIREADVRSAGLRQGLVDVKIASFDDTHSSMKFVIPVAQRKAVPFVVNSRSQPV
jgi:hypothetical protein